MLIKAILDVVYAIFSVLTAPINIPAMPDSVSTIMADALEYIRVGLQIVASYTHLSYLLVLFGIVVAVDVGILVYKFVMWVLRKIPMLGLS